MTNLDIIKAAGALIAYPRNGAGKPDGVLVHGETANVRRAAAALGLSFERVSDKVTHLSDDAGYVGYLSGDGERSSFQVYESTAVKLGLSIA